MIKSCHRVKLLSVTILSFAKSMQLFLYIYTRLADLLLHKKLDAMYIFLLDLMALLSAKNKL